MSALELAIAFGLVASVLGVVVLALFELRDDEDRKKLDEELEELGRAVVELRIVVVDAFTPALVKAGAALERFTQRWKETKQ